jgi:multimeric flavodoxin WrbA
VDSISFDIMDLKCPGKREQLGNFAESLFEAADKKSATSRFHPSLIKKHFDYQPASPQARVKPNQRKVLILTDQYKASSNLGKMIDRFRQVFSAPVELIDLNDIDIKGACLGCMKCGYDYKCQYKDGFAEFYNNRVRTADIIVLAGEMKGRYLSSLWKTFFDRAFFWNHTPSLERKQIAYLVSGPLSQNSNLIQILEASVTARQNANFVDVITDEYGESEQIDAQLDGLAAKMIQLAERDQVKPPNFLAVGGHKVFRDNIWGRLRGLWQADHRYYKKNGYYDFPQNNYKSRLLNSVIMALTKIPKFRKKYYDSVKKMPSQRMAKAIEKAS